MNFTWDPDLYDGKHEFVSRFGEDLINLLNPKKNETVLDLGCGTGDLTKNISDSCAMIIGLDKSSEMIMAAQKKYPEIIFHNADAKDFHLNSRFNAIFSNSLLHWIPEAEKVIQNINKHLKYRGRFVAEFGGKGCLNKILGTLTDVLDGFKMKYPKVEDILYYPTIGEYSKLLEQNGFEVNYALLFDRPTELKGGLDGLNNFIEMFFTWLFKDVTDTDKSRIMGIVSKRLKPEIFKGTTWIADYRRIRIIAVKTKPA